MIDNSMTQIKQYHHTTPKLIGEIDHDKYVYAVCRCHVDTRYGLMINRDDLTEYEKETGWCYIHCKKCDTDIEVGINKIREELKLMNPPGLYTIDNNVSTIIEGSDSE